MQWVWRSGQLSFNGSGTFLRLFSWQTDRANGIKIRSDRMDDEFEGIAAGLSNCITRDGQSNISSDIPWNNKKITNLANATGDSHALNRQTGDGRYYRNGADLTAETDLADGDIFPFTDASASNGMRGTVYSNLKAKIINGLALAARTITAGSGLTGGGDLTENRTLAVGQGTGIVVNADDVAVDKATAANIRACASNKVVTADGIESACAPVALTDAATVAVDWDAGIYFTLTVAGDRQIGNPTNAQIGTMRYLLVQGSDTTDRTITWANQYLGEVPVVSDCDSGRWYLFSILCLGAGHFVVAAKRAKG